MLLFNHVFFLIHSINSTDMKKILTTVLICVSMLQLNAQETNSKRTINVNGTAQMEIVPDEIYVQVELREYNKKNGTKVDIEEIRNNFLNACKSLGFTEEDLSVQGYQGWDGNYWLYKKNQKKNPDMKASVTYWVKVKNTRQMDQLVQKMDDEATQNFSIAKVWSSKMEEYKKQLKIEAAKNAKEKAAYLAEAVGEKIGEVVTINDPEEINHYPTPRYYAMSKSFDVAGAGAEAPMNVDFKKINLQFSINIVFALK